MDTVNKGVIVVVLLVAVSWICSVIYQARK